ncbi:MAG: outer membrane protein transport protein, partial [Polyangiaceae bacterium]|nr:outer membrane protein transport protein [Polyangiaceae bacterium]
MKKLNSLVALALAALVFAPSVAHAGGFWLTDRGTRPMSRGFAFVAGADDPQALWYNPAGLAWSGQQLMLDSTYMFFDGTYARVDSGGNQLPEVNVGQVPLPIPGGAYSHPLSEKLTLGVGLFAPNALLVDYDDYFDVSSGAPCDPSAGDPYCVQPQRYSADSLGGSLLSNIAVALAWRPIKQLSIGFGANVMVGT